MKKWIFILLCFTSKFSFSQDSIVGKYCPLYHESKSEELLFYNNHFMLMKTCFTEYGNKETFFGEWQRFDDSTIYVHFDSIQDEYKTVKVKKRIDKVFIQTQFTLNQKFIIENKTIYIPYRKRAGFYPNDSIKYEIKQIVDYKCITTYYPNGFINEIIEYKKGKRHGTYFKYNENGILISQEFWKKGKKQKRVIQYYDNGIINWNKTILK